MSKHREVPFKKEFSKDIGQLNITNTALIYPLTGEEPTSFVKSIYIPDPNMKAAFEFSIKMLYGNNQAILVKPEKFTYDDQKKCFLLFCPVLEMSLQNIILFHKEKKKRIHFVVVYNCVCKIYDMISKIMKSSSQNYHFNLKPTNIFYQQKGEKEDDRKQIEFKITEFGLHTNFPNKYYRQPQINYNKSQVNYNRSKTFIPLNQSYLSEVYSLGVIILEMVTLLPIDKIYERLLLNKDVTKVFKQEFVQVNKEYGLQLIEFVKSIFLSNTFDNHQEAFKAFRGLNEDEQKGFRFQGKIDSYKEIRMTPQKFKNIARQNPYERTVARLKKQIENSEITFDEVLKKSSVYDPEQDFIIKSFDEIRGFLQENNIFQNQDDEVLELNFYMKIASQINYMEILNRAFDTKDIVEGVIKIAILKYDNRKQFFNAQIDKDKTQFWKAEDIFIFFQSLGVNLQKQSIEKVVNQWLGGNKRASIKFEQFNKIFKGIGNQPVMRSSQLKTHKTSENQKDLRDILLELKISNEESGKNLIQFFRVYDTNGNWVVQQQIEKHIKNKISIDDKTFKEICEEMWEEVGATGKKKELQYVKLLKYKKIYDLTELFKLVLVEKINQSDRETFYRSYQKDGKGWNNYSIIDFNHNQQLDFTEPELNAIFRQLDQDKSGYLDQKQLIFRLTGLKQFDKQFIINKIKQEVGSKWDLFDVFMMFDKNGSLHYDSPGKLMEAFQQMSIQIPAQHCEDLFKNFMRNGKFPYMQFLRYFVSTERLFLKSCLFFIDRIYEGNFEKFYEIGRIKNKVKWSKQSLDAVNDELLLGFSEKQVDELWEVLSKNESALTKQEVADIFNCSAEPDEAILGLQATNKNKEEVRSKKKSEQNKIIEKQQDKIKEINKNDLITKLLDKNITQIALCFIKKSRNSCSLTMPDFCKCLDALNIKYFQNQVLKNTSQFQEMEEKSSSMKINFFNFLMYLCQYEEDGKQERKSQCLSIFIKELMKFKETSTQDVFKKCRQPGKMKLTEFQNFIRKIVQSQIYYDDIEDVWRYYGYPEFLTPDDFTKMLNFDGGKRQERPKVTRQFSFAQQENIRGSTGQESDDSPYFPKKVNQKNESKDKQRNLKIEIPKKSLDRTKQDNMREGKQEIALFNKPSAKSNDREETKEISKAYVIQKFQNQLKEKGSQNLNILFSKSDTISTQTFINFIKENYKFTKQESEKLGQVIGSFGKIKMQAIKKYIRRSESPTKKEQKNQNAKKQISKKEIVRDPRKNKQVQNIDEGTKLQDPKKMRLNIPLIKEHIKMLVGSFSKRFDVNEMEPYFFEGNTNITKQLFIRKCLQINSSISKQMYQKIFLYLKPKQGEVSSVSFKLSFSFDEEIQVQDIYFPDQIENEIRSLFEKCDKDKSGFIQSSEIENLLSHIGVNETQKEIDNYFIKIDQNFDKKISFKQFKLFIEQFVLSFLGDFDEDVDALNQLLKMNDVFRTGFIPVTTLALILQRYGVKIGEKEVLVLNRYLANQNNEIEIKKLLFDIGHPTQSIFPSSLKAVLYKIRWRKKVTFKDIQKIFENISACFVMSYTSQLVKSKLLTPSTFITPIINESRMFYNDFVYKNISQIDPKQPVLVHESKQTDLIVQIKLIDASGIPIPQNQNIKNSILNRYVNIIFYDTSIESGKDCFMSIQAEFDADTEDQWIFNKNNRSIFVKIGNYQNRKYQKVLLLFEFVITVIESGKSIEISCGTSSIPIRDLLIDSKSTKKIKIIAGIPNKSKDIDKQSVSKRKGWRGLLGTGQVDSQFQIELIPASKIQDKIGMICALPQKSIVNRKFIHFLWTFRQYFALKAVDNRRINPDFGNHFLVKTFVLCLDVPDVTQQLIPFWKERIEPKCVSVEISRKVFHALMQDLFIVLNSKQFDLLPSCPTKSSYTNKSLQSLRKKLLQQVFKNVQEWVKNDPQRQYKRKKAYGLDSSPFLIEEREINTSTKVMLEQLMKVK